VDKYYCDGYREVLVIDGEDDSIVGRIPLPGRALSMTGNDASSLVVFGVDVYPGLDSVLVVDAVADTVVSALAVGRTPYSLAWSPATGLVYCASASSNTVSVIAGDGSGVLKTIAVGDAPFVFALAPGPRRLYLGHLNSRMVYVIRDTTSAVAEEPERAKPTCPAATLTRGRLRVAEPGRLYDTGGRQVCLLRRGGNDVRHLAPGVYTVHLVTGALSRVVKVR
jgi:YVTN family beta-propeller protein